MTKQKTKKYKPPLTPPIEGELEGASILFVNRTFDNASF